MQTVHTKKIMLNIPVDLLNEVEIRSKKNNSNRSALIRESLRTYLNYLKRRELQERLKEGYLVNAERDREIAEKFVYSDYELEIRLASQEGK